MATVRTVAIGEVALQVWDEGQGSAIVLLHGIPTTNNLWKEVAPLLVDAGYCVIAPDLAGFGRSDAPDGVEIHVGNQAAWMWRLLDTMAIDRLIIVGHDIGAAVAQIMTVGVPSRVRGLVLMDGVFGDSWPVDAMTRIAAWDPSAASKLFGLLVQRIPATGTTTGVPEDRIRELLAPYEGEAGGLRLIRMAKSLDSSHTRAIQDELGRLRPPALLLWGDQDRFQPVDTVAYPLAELLGAELKLLPGGHFLPLDRPSEIAREIIHFAGSLGSCF